MQAKSSDALMDLAIRDDCGELLEQCGNTALLTYCESMHYRIHGNFCQGRFSPVSVISRRFICTQCILWCHILFEDCAIAHVVGKIGLNW